MNSRRDFIGKMATGLAGTLAVPGSVLGASDRVRLGVIGAGDRGMQLARESLACPNTEIAAFADVYSRRLEDARLVVPACATHADYRRLLDDHSIDAVFIATPQHLHAEHFIAALDAGKHVYLEKTMAFTVDEAKRMAVAYRNAGRRVVQIGHQACSSGQVIDAVNFATTGNLGKITAIRAHMYRNTPLGKPHWTRPVYPDMTPENIAWDAFLGDAPRIPFDVNRFVNWRLFWDYSGGNFYESMSQQVAFWYKVLGLQIPLAVTASGGIFLWKDGREVPDTMSVTLEQPEEILFSWDSGFGNDRPGMGESVLGTSGTIERTQQLRYLPQKVNRPGAAEMLGVTPTEARAHVQNFFDAVRTGIAPNCPFDLGLRVSIVCRMAVESHRLGRTVRWDSQREEIV
jgi:predicted dehydrogenase